MKKQNSVSEIQIPSSVLAKIKKKSQEQQIKEATQFAPSTEYLTPISLPADKKPKVVNHFGWSGGKDSTALLAWAIHESGYPRDSIEVSFCDTGNESQITYDYRKYTEDKLQVGITVIKPMRGFFELAKWKKRFPSARARFCTEYLKVIPTQAWIEFLCQQFPSVVLHTGVRASESEERSKLAPESFDERFGAIVKRPLLYFSIQQVWAMHHKYGIKPNPLYLLGMSRVGCFPCCMSRKEEIRRIALYQPAAIDNIRTMEPQINPERAGDGSEFRGSTFFKMDTVTAPFRTKKWVRKKDGKVFMLPTIDDVVAWSQTSKGGRQFELHFDDILNIDERLPEEEKTRSCPSSLGMCE